MTKTYGDLAVLQIMAQQEVSRGLCALDVEEEFQRHIKEIMRAMIRDVGMDPDALPEDWNFEVNDPENTPLGSHVQALFSGFESFVTEHDLLTTYDAELREKKCGITASPTTIVLEFTITRNGNVLRRKSFDLSRDLEGLQVALNNWCDDLRIPRNASSALCKKVMTEFMAMAGLTYDEGTLLV